MERPVPSGKVKWFDVEKGFGFLSQEDGPDVYVHADALPEGTATLKAGTKVEFGIAMPLNPQLGLGIAAGVLGAWATFVLVSRPARRPAPARETA